MERSTALHRRLLGGKDVLFEKALADKFFQVLLEASTVDDLVPLRTIFFRSGECRIVLDWLRALYPRLILDDVEDFVDVEPQQSEVLFHLEGLEWTRWEDRQCLSFVSRLPPIWVIGTGWNSILWLWFLSFSTFERLVRGSSSSLPPTGCKAGLRTEPPPSEWHRVSVGVYIEGGDLQFANEHKCRDIFTVVDNLGELILKVVDV